MKMTEGEIQGHLQTVAGCSGDWCWPCNHYVQIRRITARWLEDQGHSSELETAVKTLLEWLPIYSPSSAGYQRVEAVKAALQENKAPKPVKE